MAKEMDLRSFLLEVRKIKLQPGDVDVTFITENGERLYGRVSEIEFIEAMIPALDMTAHQR